MQTSGGRTEKTLIQRRNTDRHNYAFPLLLSRHNKVKPSSAEFSFRLDDLMKKYHLEAEEVVEHFYTLFTASRLHLDEQILAKLLIALAECDASLKNTAVGRIQLELFLHQVAEIGSKQVIA